MHITFDIMRVDIQICLHVTFVYFTIHLTPIIIEILTSAPKTSEHRRSLYISSFEICLNSIITGMKSSKICLIDFKHYIMIKAYHYKYVNMLTFDQCLLHRVWLTSRNKCSLVSCQIPHYCMEKLLCVLSRDSAPHGNLTIRCYRY